MRVTKIIATLNKPFRRSGALAREAGMSLIEIIIVIALMGTLMTIVITNLTGKQQQAMVDAASLAMSQLETDLQNYKIHNFAYPTTDQGLDALVTQPSSAKKWRGPYTEEKKLHDPWGTKYQYESDGKTFKVISAGPDQNFGTADDIIYPNPDGEQKKD